jgi:hypothetical protein
VFQWAGTVKDLARSTATVARLYKRGRAMVTAAVTGRLDIAVEIAEDAL